MSKRRKLIPLNDLDEAFGLYADLMPAVTDVRGEDVFFDWGSYAHFTRRRERGRFVNWIRETITNPEEIRKDFDHRHPNHEVYVNTFYEAEDAPGRSFVVIVKRTITLHFWTAFDPGESYLAKVKEGELLWRAENN